MKTIAMLLAVTLAVGCSSKEEQASPAPASKPGPRAQAPTYEGTPEGLARLVRDMAAARAGSEAGRFGDLVDGLRLPDPEQWFSRVFAGKGPVLAERYAAVSTYLPVLLGQAFDGYLQTGRPETLPIEVSPLTADTAQGRARTMLAAMQQPVTLYEVYVAGQRLRYFVYEGGAWRTTGKMWSAF